MVQPRQNAVAIANKNRVESLIYDSLDKMGQSQEEQIRQMNEIVGTVQGLKECQEKQSNQMKELTELVGVLNTGLVSKYVLLKYKILKSITFGSLHQKYKRIYKSLKMIHSKYID